MRYWNIYKFRYYILYEAYIVLNSFNILITLDQKGVGSKLLPFIMIIYVKFLDYYCFFDSSYLIFILIFKNFLFNRLLFEKIIIGKSAIFFKVFILLAIIIFIFTSCFLLYILSSKYYYRVFNNTSILFINELSLAGR